MKGEISFSNRQVIFFAAAISFLAFLTTLQLHVNSSGHPYATDVGELQNALPRWGTIHFSGYPQYTFLGSLFVTVLRPLLPPVIGTALFSAVWGSAAIALLVWLLIELNIPKWIAVGVAVPYALSTSIWAVAYTQKYEGQFSQLQIVDHNADFSAIVDEGHQLLTLSQTFYGWPLSWWNDRLGEVHLSSPAPDVIEISPQPKLESLEEKLFSFGNGVRIETAELSWNTFNQLRMDITWQAEQSNLPDYSVAVHLVAQDPPTGPHDILAQTDAIAPVYGWYPTSRWQQGEHIRDQYLLNIPSDIAPKSIRVSFYRQQADGTFENSSWLSIPFVSPPKKGHD